MNQRILLIQAGGTIDAEPYEDPRNPPEIVKVRQGRDSLVLPVVSRLPQHEKVDGFIWLSWEQAGQFAKDSKLLTREDIGGLAEIIKCDDHGYVVITHGTDAMVKNTLLLQSMLGFTDKRVVMVGAMVPLSMHERYGSDGVLALEFALENISAQNNGVYIVGRGTKSKQMEFFNPTNVEKDREVSRAEISFTLKSRN